MGNYDLFEGSDEEEEGAGEYDAGNFRQAVVYTTDWTVETVVSQLSRGNIDLDPGFQRRDAWNLVQKSRYVESLLLGLPIPQIVLAEDRVRGRFLVLDGKQRLLTLLQFFGRAEKLPNNEFSLTGLQVRDDLRGKSFADLEREGDLRSDLDFLQNQTIRTVVIRNWPDDSFLHLVFLRLNTGSVKLSPQELRQALVRGPFTKFVDEAAVSSEQLRTLLQLDAPDRRMRDVELLARHLAFRFFLSDYHGRMREFLDHSFRTLNRDWASRSAEVAQAVREFNASVDFLNLVFGKERVARKRGSRSFNRAIFEALTYYLREPPVIAALEPRAVELRASYDQMFDDLEFVQAVERDTAGVGNTAIRLETVGRMISAVSGLALRVPAVVDGSFRVP